MRYLILILAWAVMVAWGIYAHDPVVIALATIQLLVDVIVVYKRQHPR
jgi:hypothetical protein